MGKLHQDDVRAKIQATKLVNRLQDHALGTVELSATQIKCAEILLKKSVSDLTSVAHTGEGGDGPIRHQIEMVIVDAAG
jgi:hypothetical protein